MSYSVAITRIPLTGLGIVTVDDSYVPGVPTLNVVDGRLNSVSVKDGDAPTKNFKAKRVLGLYSGASAKDRLVFQSYKR